jgi:uncharacterized membrane protein (UPF0136 family)
MREGRRQLAYACLIALVFGGVDQYLGASWVNNHVGLWPTSVSQLVAPWLTLPFVFGARERTARSAVVVGLCVTACGLLGYFLMTNSPIESVTLSQIHVGDFIRSQARLLAAGVVSGPLFGWLGFRWRLGKSRAALLLLAAAFCLEPAITRLVTSAPVQLPTPPDPGVSIAEVAVGLALGAYALLTPYRSASD